MIGNGSASGKCRAAWLLGLTIREHRALEAGEGHPLLVSRVWERMVALYGWPV